MHFSYLLTALLALISTSASAQTSTKNKVNGSGSDADNYFTAVIFSDPHVEQTGHDGATAATFATYSKAIANLGKSGGKVYQFNSLPGYTPTADIVFCLGDMDGDSEKTGSSFKAAFHYLNAAGIPFITMVGNHDIVPDYWTGDNPDPGLTVGFAGGYACNEVAMALIDAQLDTAQTHGITDLTRITDGTAHRQAEPFTFTFNGVRFYCGQAYWFQKPYDTFTNYNNSGYYTGTAKYYAPDGVISTLESFVNNHTSEPSVWMQHYPIVAGSDNARWWLDQNDVGKYIATEDESEYGTDISTLGSWSSDATAQSYATKKRDKLTELISKTKNAVHFSGHMHSYATNTYNGVTDYTVAAPGISDGGMFLVLISKTEGVKEIKRIDLIDFATANADSIGVIDNTASVTLTAGADVTALLGTNLDFETTQGDSQDGTTNIHFQPGWSNVYSMDATSGNIQYTHLYQVTDQASGASTSTALRIRTKWQKNAINNYIFKEATIPAGVYTLTYYIKKEASAGITEDLNYYEINGERTALPSTSSWSKQTVTLTFEEESTFRLNFGYRGGAGSNEALVYVDDITLTYEGSYQEESYTKYLFAYFPSNSDENVYYAVADKDTPYDFTVLNDGKMVLDADSVSVKGGLRDPHILRGNGDGYYYMVATDMKSAEGWSSNRGIVMMRSKDLVNWEHHTVHFPTKYADTDFANVTRVWAPETIYDEEAGKYMIYFSLLGAGSSNTYDKVYYAYANDDFSDLVGEPTFMYDRGSATIDMDIIKVGDTYHGFYKNEGTGGIGHITSTSLTGNWTLVSDAVQQTSVAVEGVGVYKLINLDKYVVMYDCYNSGYYEFCSTYDFDSYTVEAKTSTSGSFTPRHGTVLPITDDEYAKIEKWIADALRRNTVAVEGASIDNPIKTDFVTNGSFDNGTTGWSYTTGAQNHGTTTNKGDKVVYLAFENWNATLAAGKMYQTISNIPNGTYMLDITAWARDNSGKQVYLNDNTVALSGNDDEANNYRIIAYISDNTAEVGLEATTAVGDWMGIDNVQLTYWSADNIVDDVKAKLLADADIDSNNNPLNSYSGFTEVVTLGDWTTSNYTTNKSQHWDGTTTSSYHEQSSGWSNSSWSMSMTQDITLSPGNYVLKLAGRAASAKVDARMTVDDKSVLIATNDDYGYGIDTSGNTNWSSEGTYANSNTGRGWEWRYLPFEVTEEGSHTITISASVADGYRHWVSFSDIQLLCETSVTASTGAPIDPDGDGTDTYWGTFYASNATTVPAGVTAYIIQYVEDEKAILTQVAEGGETIPGSEGYLISTVSAQDALTFVTSTSTPVSVEDNMLKGSSVTKSFAGEGTYYVLSRKTTDSVAKYGFYYQYGTGGTSVTNNAHKAFLLVPGSTEVKSLMLSLNNESTGIDSSSLSTTPVSYDIYNLQGLRVNDNYKGVVIKNGKKLIQK